jgi:hypothetical protein
MAYPLDSLKIIRQQRYFKITLFYFLGFFLSFIFWLLIKVNFDLVFLIDGGITNLIISLFSLLFFCLFFSFFANCVYLLKRFYLTIGLILLVNIPYLAIFGFNLFALEGFLILTLLFYIWAKRIDHYDKRHAPFSPLISGRIGLRFAITIFLLVISFSFYIVISYEGQANYFIPRLEKYTVSLSHQGLNLLIPRYDKDIKVDDALHLILKNKLWQKFIPTKNEINLSDPQTVSLLRKSLEEKLNISLENKSFDYLISYLVNNYIIDNLMKYQNIFSSAAALAFFLFLKLFSWVYYLLIRGFSWIWLKIFLFGKIVNKKTETIEIEKIAI